MLYKVLYIEDQIAASIEDDLVRLGYEVISNDADSFDSLMDVISTHFDAYIFDYRLTSNKGRLDAPAYAQSMRSNKKRDCAPIFLISNEDNLKEFDKDLTSQDLFDFAVSKEEFRKNLDKYALRIESFIKAYRCIIHSNFQLDKILAKTIEEIRTLIDYRLVDKLYSEKIGNDVYSFCHCINTSLIRCIGPLVGEDILSARLGVDKNSNDWQQLVALLEKFKYHGILANVYPRWWMEEILIWWSNLAESQPLRRLSSKERVEILSKKLNLDLLPITPVKHSRSTCFWTICSETKNALDPSEGYIINKKELAPWQEMEYLSLNAALEQSDYRKYLSPTDKAEIRKFEEDASF